MDIGFGDIIFPGPISIEFPTLIEMEPPKIFAYSIESMVAEKFEAMIDLAEFNSRMKDFYDVYQILLKKNFKEDTLTKAIFQTFKRRSTLVTKDHILFKEAFYEDEKRQNKWMAFLTKSKLNKELKFSVVMKKLAEILEPIYNKMI